MAVSNVELRVDARQAVNALQQVNRASTEASAATDKLKSASATAGQAQSAFSAKIANTESAIRKEIAALRDLKSKVELGSDSYKKAAGQIAEYEAKLKAANSTQNNTRLSGQGLIGILGGIAAAYGQLRLAQQAVQTGIQREESVRRLQFLAKGYDEVTQAQLAAARAGKQFGLSATESNQQFAQLYGRLRPLNVSLADIETAFIGFNTSAKVSGTTSAEAAGAFLQLTQALGSGVLRGQELNSVLEQAPGLVVALTKELGVPVSQIRKLAEEGKITSDVVIRALKRAGTDGADQLAAAMQGPRQQIKNLQNEFENFQAAVAETILPATIGAVKKLTELLQNATQYVKDFGAGWKILGDNIQSAVAPFSGILNVLGQIDGKLRSIGQRPALNILSGLLPGGPLGPLVGAPAQLGQGARRSAQGSGMYGRYAPGSEQVNFQRTGGGGARVVAAASGGGGGGKGKTDAERAAEAAKKEAERVAEVIRSRLAEGQITRLNSELKDKIAAAEASGDKQLAARLQGQQKELDIQYRYAQELAKEKDIKAQEAIIYEGNVALIANQRDLQRELNELENESARNQIKALEDQLGRQYELTNQQRQQKELADGIAGTVGQGMASAFDSLIQGSEDFGTSLRRIASGVLIDIANQLLRVFVIQKAINAISGLFGGGGGGLSYAGVKGNALSPSMISGGFTNTPFSAIGLGFRATGGSVTGNRPYLVGERGPELFMPGRSGGIAPSGSFGGGVNVVVNVDATGSNVQGDDQRAKQLGQVVAVAVRQEIIKQKRPGGLL